MYVWQGNIVDEAGNVIPSAVIDVLYAGTSTRPTIYADSSGTALANPFNADVHGFARFYTGFGSYDIRATGDGRIKTWHDVRLGDGSQPYADRATAEAANVPAAVQRISYVSSSGYIVQLRRKSSEPSHAGKLQTNDGAWWELELPAYSAVLPQQISETPFTTAAINTAFEVADAIGARAVSLPPGTYDGTDDKVTGKSGVSLFGVEGQSVIDFSGRASYNTDLLNGLISYKGTAGAGVLSTDSTTTLTADASIGDTTLTLADTSALTAGDLIEVSETGAGPWVDSSIAVRVAQLIKIASVDSSTQITLAAPCRDAYTTANSAGVRLVAPVKDFEIRGIRVIGKGRDASTSGDVGLTIYFGAHFRVHRCQFIGVDARSISPVSCYDFDIDDNYLWTDEKGANNSVNYGIAYTSACTDGRMKGNRIINFRHGIVSSHLSMALSEEYPGISRAITIENNHIVNTWHAGISVHNDCEDVYYIGNHLINCDRGLEFRDKNVTARNNTIRGCNLGIMIRGRATAFSVIGNVFIACTNPITWDDIDSGFTPDNITIDENIILGEGVSETGVYIWDQTAAAPGVIAGVSVSGNEIYGLVLAGHSAAIRVIGADWQITACDNTIADITGGYGMRLDGGSGCILGENYIDGANISIYVDASASDTILRNNTVQDYATSPIIDNSTSTIQIGNIDRGAIGTGVSVEHVPVRGRWWGSTDDKFHWRLGSDTSAVTAASHQFQFENADNVVLAGLMDSASAAAFGITADLETGANYANMIYSFSIDSWVWNVAGSQVARMASNFFGPSTTDDAYLLGRSTNRFSDGYITQLRPGDGTPIWTSGSGSPESAVTAPVGSLYTRTDGGASTTLYVKESGTGNTGWVAK